MPNELQGILALLFIVGPLAVYGVFLKLHTDKLGRLIAEEEAVKRARVIDPR